ncbi:MAG: TerB family tellurite resistance protein [Granulosicoccaceae bacterium]
MALKAWWQKFQGSSTEPENHERKIQLATAALLIEITRADATVDAIEQQRVEELLRSRTGLQDEALTQLIQEADVAVDEAVSLVDFSRVLVESLSPDERGEVIDMLWQVAYADGRVDRYEDYYVRKLAELLYVPHSRFIQGKLRASGEF